MRTRNWLGTGEVQDYLFSILNLYFLKVLFLFDHIHAANPSSKVQVICLLPCEACPDYPSLSLLPFPTIFSLHLSGTWVTEPVSFSAYR